MKKQHFFSWLTLISFSALTMLSCGKSSSNNYGTTTPPPPVGGSGANITMTYMSFSPASKTVAKGTVVKWTNNDSYAHTVTSNDGTSFSSGNIAGGGTYSYTASTPGTFEYHCSIHGFSMSGTLIVNP